MQIDLSPEAIFALSGLTQEEWTKAFDALKIVQHETWGSAGKFCPKADWPEFHARRVKNAKDTFQKWSAIRAELAPHLNHLINNPSL